MVDFYGVEAELIGFVGVLEIDMAILNGPVLWEANREIYDRPR